MANEIWGEGMLIVDFICTETKAASYEADMTSLKNNNTSNDEESRSLRVRVTSLESEKREIWEVLERKNTAYDQLQEEYQQQQGKLLDLRKEVSSMENKTQQSDSAQSAAKFREQKLRQELEITKKNGEWLDGEFNAKSAELSRYRKEKNAQVNKLQRDLEESHSKAIMAERNVEVLKARYDEVSRKLSESQVKIKDLNDSAATQEDAFRAEVASARRLAELWEKSTMSARTRVTQIEQMLENERSSQSDEVGRIQSVSDALKEENAHANQKIEELEVQIERLEADLASYAQNAAASIPNSPAPGRRSFNGPPVTPQRRAGTATPERGFFSPAAQAIAQSQKTGLSLTQMYTDYTNMKRDLEAANTRNARLQDSFDELIAELESKAPEFDTQKDELDRATEEILGMSELLNEANGGKEAALKEAAGLRRKAKDQKAELNILKQRKIVLITP